MSDSQPHDEQSNVAKILGFIFLVFVFLGVYWIAGAIIQLWSSPRSVPFVTLFIELLEENQQPIMRSVQGSEIYLPASWPVVIGIFLSVVLISSVGLLIRCFLSNALILLFPESYPTKGVVASVIERLKSKPGKKL